MKKLVLAVSLISFISCKHNEGSADSKALDSGYLYSGSVYHGSSFSSLDFPGHGGLMATYVFGRSFGNFFLLTCASSIVPPNEITSGGYLKKNYDIADIQGGVIGRASTETNRYWKFDAALDVAVLAPHVNLTTYREVSFRGGAEGHRESENTYGIGDPVEFNLGTTRRVTGVIKEVNANVSLNGFNLDGQFLVETSSSAPRFSGLSPEKDCGSLVFNKNGYILGMLRGRVMVNGQPSATLLIVTPFARILEWLESHSFSMYES